VATVLFASEISNVFVVLFLETFDLIDILLRWSVQYADAIYPQFKLREYWGAPVDMCRNFPQRSSIKKCY
jgi:hypothetical protein